MAHVLLDVTDEDSLMLEEIFGPILPVKAVDSVDEVKLCLRSFFATEFCCWICQAIEVMHRVHLKPLALYIFARKQSVINR